jgi:hypothetical protein
VALLLLLWRDASIQASDPLRGRQTGAKGSGEGQLKGTFAVYPTNSLNSNKTSLINSVGSLSHIRGQIIAALDFAVTGI